MPRPAPANPALVVSLEARPLQARTEQGRAEEAASAATARALPQPIKRAESGGDNGSAVGPIGFDPFVFASTPPLYLAIQRGIGGAPDLVPMRLKIAALNWCGMGKGRPIDRVDRACMAHDYCYTVHGYKWLQLVVKFQSVGRAEAAAV